MSRSRDPLTDRLRDAILSLQPTAYWPLDDGGSPLRDIAGGNWNATVTGSPSRVAAQEPIGSGWAFSGSGQYGAVSASIPTPTASISVLGLFRTTDAAAAQRQFLTRHAASQASWTLGLGTTHGQQFICYQSGGSAHASAGVGTASNDGRWTLYAGSFDGTTIRAYRVSSTGTVAENTSTSLTGTWHTASTAAVGIAHRNTALLWPGDLAHLAYWRDGIVLNRSHATWLGSVAFGG